MMMQRVFSTSAVLFLLGASGVSAQSPAADPADAPGMPISAPSASPLVQGKRALAAKQFVAAKRIFAASLKEHPDSIEAELGLADAELGLHEDEAAEIEYRKVTARQPELWAAHKNLVIVEAALGRWEEFDNERALLRGARERGAPGITAHESDVIDSFTVRGQRWIVREYFEPAGRSLTRYNFEHFSADGKAEEYVSLESEEAAKAVVAGGAVTIGGKSAPPAEASHFALNWYTGKAHGTIVTYASEPTYERGRADFLKWAGRSRRP